jgi:monoamine oxidase
MVMSRYQAFAEHLGKHPNIHVLLGHGVKKIEADGESYSTVKCANGKTFNTEKVVIAVPLGVLKKEAIEFSPKLPEWKGEAIEKLQMGNVCKILIVPRKNFNITDKEHYIGVVADDVNKRGAATYFFNIASFAKMPAYMTFGLGQNSDELEEMPEAQLKHLIANRLGAITDGVSPNDFDIVRSSWRGNENFGGAYTYSAVNTYPKHWENMAKPVFSSGWYFCGEHTNSKYRGTVHGGYLSGVHTAEYILDEVSEQKWKYADRS